MMHQFNCVLPLDPGSRPDPVQVNPPLYGGDGLALTQTQQLLVFLYFLGPLASPCVLRVQSENSALPEAGAQEERVPRNHVDPKTNLVGFCGLGPHPGEVLEPALYPRQLQCDAQPLPGVAASTSCCAKPCSARTCQETEGQVICLCPQPCGLLRHR